MVVRSKVLPILPVSDPKNDELNAEITSRTVITCTTQPGYSYPHSPDIQIPYNCSCYILTSTNTPLTLSNITHLILPIMHNTNTVALPATSRSCRRN